MRRPSWPSTARPRLAAAGSLDGALVTIDAIACNPKVAKAVVDAGADYLIAVKANQPGLFVEIERFFDDPQSPPPDRATETDKGHGRVEQRGVAVSTHVDWMEGERRFPGEYRLPNIAAMSGSRPKPSTTEIRPQAAVSMSPRAP